MRLTDFKVLSFDCYGTLIDWETGICAALQPLAARSGQAFTRDQLLEAHARHEAAQEAATPELRYADLLARVHDRIAGEWGLAPDPEESRAYGLSVRDWPAFPDSAAALQYLKRHYQLVILSNVDRESFKASNARLQVAFDHIFTAQDIGSYKPDPRNFEYLTGRLAEAGFQRQEILHTAESLFHDHVPANRAGLASAWIHRRAGQAGHGATHAPEVMPHYDFHFTSLADMVQAHQNELA
jgi:2-haloacid dehalogenase/putative hydrolase of the HAD superfamily